MTWLYWNNFQSVGGEKERKIGGTSAVFSVDSVAPVSRTFFETRGSKLSINNIEIQAAVTALEEARRLEYPQVRLCTSSTMLLAIVTKHLQQWKQKKWKRCNGSRLTLPISLLKKLDRLLAALDVEAEWSTLHSPLIGGDPGVSCLLLCLYGKGGCLIVADISFVEVIVTCDFHQFFHFY